MDLLYQREVSEGLKGGGMVWGQSIKNELVGSKLRDALRIQRSGFSSWTNLTENHNMAIP